MARPILLRPHQLIWAAHFQTQAQSIAKALGEACLTVEHIGSTAVAGLWAKPIIDMLVVLRDTSAIDASRIETSPLETSHSENCHSESSHSKDHLLDPWVAALCQLGYQCKGENGIAGRRYFVLPVSALYADLGPQRSHHLHLFVQGHPAIAAHLQLRDYLRAHPAAVAAYNQAKQQAFAESGGQSERYSALKDPMVSQLAQAALAWASPSGEL